MSGAKMDALQAWATMLEDDDFYDDQCKRAFAGIKVCLMRARTPDIGTLCATKYILNSEITNIMSAPVSTAKMKQHIELLKEYAMKRAVIYYAEELQGKMLGSTTPKDDAIDMVSKLNAVCQKKSIGNLMSTRKTVYDTLQMLREGNSADSKLRVFFNVDFMDSCLLAFRREVVVIAANSGGGKTSLGLTCLLNQVLTGQQRIAYFCNESDTTKLMAKLFSQYVGCSFVKLLLHSDELTQDELSRLKEVSELMEKNEDKIHLYGAGSYEHTVAGITSVVQEIQEQHGQIDMIYVDYLQDMTPPSEYKPESADAIAYNIQGIKNLCQRTNSACCVLCQINRDASKPDVGRYTMSCLKGSSKIENVASIVVFLQKAKFKKDVMKVIDEQPVVPIWFYTDKTRDQESIFRTFGFLKKCAKFVNYTAPSIPRYDAKYNPEPVNDRR